MLPKDSKIENHTRMWDKKYKQKDVYKLTWLKTSEVPTN